MTNADETTVQVTREYVFGSPPSPEGWTIEVQPDGSVMMVSPWLDVSPPGRIPGPYDRHGWRWVTAQKVADLNEAHG